MIHEQFVSFQLKGNRSYVHGTDIYGAALKTLYDHFGLYPSTVKGTFHDLLASHGVFRIYDSKCYEFQVKHFAAFHVDISGVQYKVMLFDAEKTTLSSYTYDEEDVLIGADFKDNSLVMPYKATYSYMEQFVAMTKKLHLNIYPDAQGKWLFTKFEINKLIDPAMYRDKALTVIAKKNFQNKLTQNTIQANSHTLGNIYFSLKN